MLATTVVSVLLTLVSTVLLMNCLEEAVSPITVFLAAVCAVCWLGLILNLLYWISVAIGALIDSDFSGYGAHLKK